MIIDDFPIFSDFSSSKKEKEEQFKSEKWDKIEPEKSDVITFDEYLKSKPIKEEIPKPVLKSKKLPKKVSVVKDEPEVITFEEYLATKVKEIRKYEAINNSNEILTFEEYLLTKIKEDKIEDVNLLPQYIINAFKSFKSVAPPNIQDPSYLEESKKEYYRLLELERKKMYSDPLGGGYSIEQTFESLCGIIGRAIIGKNQIC